MIAIMHILYKMTPTLKNTRFVSVGAYFNPHERCHNFIKSAEKFNVPLIWISWGEEWKGFAHHKLRLFRDKCIELRKNGIKYIFMLDSKDVVFTDDVNVILRKAAEIHKHGMLLFNAEWSKHIYPYKNDYFLSMLKQKGCHLNSGLIFGEVDTFITVVGLSLEIMDGIKNSKPMDGIATYIYNDSTIQHKLDSDQFHYQIASIYYPQYFRVDIDRYLFAWVGVIKKTLKYLREGQVGYDGVGQACLIHSSSTIHYGSQQMWDDWVEQNVLNGTIPSSPISSRMQESDVQRYYKHKEITESMGVSTAHAEVAKRKMRHTETVIAELSGNQKIDSDKNDTQLSPIVTIIIPVYNVETYLCQCLDSIVNQTLRNIQIICVDDGSTDKSFNILQDYAQSDSRITVIHQSNRGVGAARNAAYPHIQGKYTCFVDGDDWIEHGLCEAVVNYAEDTNAEIVYFGYFLEFPDKKKLYSFDSPALLLTEPISLKERVRLLMGDCMTWMRMYRTDFLQSNQIKCADKSPHEDSVFHWKCIIFANRIVFLNRHFYHHRRSRPGSYCTVSDKRNIKENLNDIETILKELGKYEEYGVFYDQWKSDYLSRWNVFE